MSAPPNTNQSGRGWLEGTLDVISNMRPSTPTSRLPFSAPSSPRPAPVTPSIARLPSQDSLDRSIHNDSGHGRSAVQTIKELRQSNARLTAKTAELEADFMNQLQAADRAHKLAQALLVSDNEQKERALQTLELRCRQSEQRMRTMEEQLTRYREESAFARHTISELRTNVANLESKTSTSAAAAAEKTDWPAEKERLLRELDAAVESTERERAERLALEQELRHLQRQVRGEDDKKEDDLVVGNQLERTQDALYRTESALVALQTDTKALKSKHALELKELRQQMSDLQTKYEAKAADASATIERLEKRDLAGDWQSQIDDSASTIEELREKVLDYSKQLTALTEETAKLKADADAQEQYRREEAEDLRILNDAQEEELESLRRQLEDALAELEVRGHEIADKQAQIDVLRAGNDPSGAREAMDEALDEAREQIESLEDELRRARTEHEEQIRLLNERIENLQQRNELMESMSSDSDERAQSAFGEITEAQWRDMLAKKSAVEARASLAEEQLADTRQVLAETEESKKVLVRDYDEKISTLRSELSKVKADHAKQLADIESKVAEKHRDTTQRAAALSTKVARLEDELLKAQEEARRLSPIREAPSHDEELQKQVDALKEKEALMAQEMEDLAESTIEEMEELQEKLDDRDTTITALVKSSVAMERQMAEYRVEIEALRHKLGTTLGGDNESEAGYDVILTHTASGEDVDDLKRSIEEMQSIEKRLTNENALLKKQIDEFRQETTRLRSQLEATRSENILLRSQLDDDIGSNVGSTAGSSVVSSSPQALLHERDNAISNLVKQSIEQDILVAELQSRLSVMHEELEFLRSSQEGPSLDEIDELRRETEMFAGQVIEQDEELEELREALQMRDEKIIALKAELAELKNDRSGEASPKHVQDLQAEIDEMEEANRVLRDEVRLLRRKASDFESAGDEIDDLKREIQEAVKDAEEYEKMVDDLSREKTAFLKEIEELRNKRGNSDHLQRKLNEMEQDHSITIRSLESKLKDSEQTVEQLRSSAASVQMSTIDEMEVDAMKDEIDDLKRSLQHQTSAVDSAKQTIFELERMLAEKSSQEAAEWDVEKEELISEIESLTEQLEAARDELKQLEEQRSIIDDFKAKLEEADEAREASEKQIVDTYERKISLLKLDKDVTIDKLRKELTELKASSSEELDELRMELGEYENLVKALKEEMVAEVGEREQRIFALEHTLEAQQQLVHNMKTEMDHLQGSMENSAVTRREEIEDMQQELVDLTSTVAKQEREIKSLQGQLQDKQVAHDLEVEKLQETIAQMENQEEWADHRTAADLQMEIRVREVKERLEKLKWRNSSLMEENTTLRERLTKSETNMQQLALESNDRDHTQELQKALEEQKQKVEELQEELAALKREGHEGLDPPPAPPLPSGKQTAIKEKKAATKKAPPPSPRRGFGILRRRSNSNLDLSTESKK